MIMVASLEREMHAARKTVFEAIFGMSGIPVGLAYPLTPANYLLKLNQQCITDADYLLLIIGEEYGALSDKGVGYLHATYASALAQRKPIVSLIYQGRQKLSHLDEFDQKRLAGFIQQLQKGIANSDPPKLLCIL